MSQQINLFNEGLLDKRSLYSARSLGLLSVVVSVCLVLLWGTLQWRFHELSKKEASSAQQLVTVQTELAQLKAGLVMPTHDPRLAQELKDIQDEIKQRRKAVDMLGSNLLGNTDGFSEYMSAFARQIPDRVWLTGFDFDTFGDRLSIHGRTLQADLVPQFVNQLKREKVMKGKAFAALDLQRPALEASTGTQEKQRPTLAPFIDFEFHTIEQGDKKEVGAKQP